MDTSFGRPVRGPRLTTLASCLALALAIGTTAATATPARLIETNPEAVAFISRFQAANAQPFHRTPRPAQEQLLASIRHPVPHERPTVPDGAIAVTNCNDSGPGSLRDIVDNVAVDGDTIDLTNTGCSTITLLTGSIFAAQENLTLQGPGFTELTIDGGNLYSLRHTGTGTFGVYDLAVLHGSKYLDASYNLDAKGGCVYSAGTVSLIGSELKYCSAIVANTSYQGIGGGVYARNGIIMSNSTIAIADAGSTTTAGIGGGAFTPGAMIMADSNISFNYARSAAGGLGAAGGFVAKYSVINNNQSITAGGVYGAGNIVVENSTISNNAAATVGGLFLLGSGATNPITVVDSTISGNTAAAVGGIAFIGYPARVGNSTIAFNVEANLTDHKYGSGLYAGSATDLESSIIAKNYLNHSTYGLILDDIGGGTGGSIVGLNNLAGLVLPPFTMPSDTLYEDPLLSPLRNNGGTTPTHALGPESPAIDAGNNNASRDYDQRGDGYPRVIGANADIGAFEFDLDDLIFADNFD